MFVAVSDPSYERTLTIGIDLQTRPGHQVLEHLGYLVARIGPVFDVVEEQVVVLAIMTGQDLLTVEVCCHLGGRAVDAPLGVLGLGVGDRDHQLLDTVIGEGSDVLMLKQFPLTGSQERVNHEHDEVIEFSKVEL